MSHRKNQFGLRKKLPYRRSKYRTNKIHKNETNDQICKTQNHTYLNDDEIKPNLSIDDNDSKPTGASKDIHQVFNYNDLNKTNLKSTTKIVKMNEVKDVIEGEFRGSSGMITDISILRGSINNNHTGISIHGNRSPDIIFNHTKFGNVGSKVTTSEDDKVNGTTESNQLNKSDSLLVEKLRSAARMAQQENMIGDIATNLSFHCKSTSDLIQENEIDMVQTNMRKGKFLSAANFAREGISMNNGDIALNKLSLPLSFYSSTVNNVTSLVS